MLLLFHYHFLFAVGLAPTSSVGHVSNRQPEQILRMKDHFHVVYFKKHTLQDLNIGKRWLRGNSETTILHRLSFESQNNVQWALSEQGPWWGCLQPALPQWSCGQPRATWHSNRPRQDHIYIGTIFTPPYYHSKRGSHNKTSIPWQSLF